MSFRTAAWLLVLAMAAAAGWALATGRVAVPAQWNPWAPLLSDEPPGLFTRYKAGQLARSPAACQAWLEGAGLRSQPLPDRDDAQGCGWQGASRVQALRELRFGSSFVLSCPAAVDLVLWERHSLQPAALQTLGSRVAAIDHLGSYACRNVYGRAEGRRSEHATANALDIAGFRLADGRRISVLRDWDDAADAPAARFLREAHQGACGFFNGVLGPGYNAEHRDHFHLDHGRWRLCR